MSGFLFRSKAVLLSVSFLLMTACGGGGGSSALSSGSSLSSGQFLDSFVEGLRYVTETQEGLTDENGRFFYKPGETVSFYIGDILLGSTSPKTLVTPIDLIPGASSSSDTAVSNLLRFLQALDDNGDPSDGILISEFVFAQAQGQSLDFSLSQAMFESNAEALLSMLTSGAVLSLVDISDAIDHFEQSFDAFYNDNGVGDFGELSLIGNDTASIGTTFVAGIAAESSNNDAVARVWSDISRIGSIPVQSAVLNYSDLGFLGSTIVLAVSSASGNGQTSTYTYVHTCGGFSGITCLLTVDEQAREITFTNVQLTVSESGPNNLATAPVTISGTLKFEDEE